LHAACEEADRHAEVFPKPGHIRAALKRLETVPSTRPEYLDERPLPASQRWTQEEVDNSNKERAKLGLPLLPPLAADKNGQSEENI
jgi:hypothetical protein